jgi:maleylacetoacetate isomerase
MMNLKDIDGLENKKQHNILKKLQKFEKFMSETKGTYCFGDEITMADIYLVPLIDSAKRLDVDIKSVFPSILAVNSTLENLP